MESVNSNDFPLTVSEDKMKAQKTNSLTQDSCYKFSHWICSYLTIFLYCDLWIFPLTDAVAQEKLRVKEAAAQTGAQATSHSPANVDQSQRAKASAEPQAPLKEKKKEPRGTLIGVPIPISSPAIGSGVVLVGGYIFSFSTKDKVSPPSTVGAAALFTNNGSRGFAVGGELFLKENTFRIKTGFARGNINYAFYCASRKSRSV